MGLQEKIKMSPFMQAGTLNDNEMTDKDLRGNPGSAYTKCNHDDKAMKLEIIRLLTRSMTTGKTFVSFLDDTLYSSTHNIFCHRVENLHD